MHYTEIIINAIKTMYGSSLALKSITCLLLTVSIIFLTYKLIKSPIIPSVVTENFKIPFLSVLLYAFLYIILILTLRYYRLGKDLDLKETLENFKKLLTLQEASPPILKIAFGLFCLTLIISWFIVIIKMRLILTDQIWKGYMYTHYISNLTSNRKASFVSLEAFPNPPQWFCTAFYTLTNVLQRNLVYQRLGDYLYQKTNKISLKLTGHKLTESPRSFHYLLQYLPLLLLLTLISVELYIRPWKLYYTFYYLILYMLLIHYIQISNTLTHYHNHPLSAILIERAYLFPEIIYINLTPVDDNILIAFIGKDKTFDSLPDDLKQGKYWDLPKYELVLAAQIWPKYFTRGYVYYNSKENIFFETKSVTREDIDHFHVDTRKYTNLQEYL